MPAEIEQPPPVYLALPRRPPEPTYEQYRHTLHQSDSIISENETLPSYLSSESPVPRYVPPEFMWKKPPPTLAMHLFRAGFFFPLLWLWGCYPLVVLPASRASSAQRSRGEHERILLLRRTELKWAKQCLAAFIFFICVCIAVGLSVWGMLKNKKPQ